MPSERSNIQSIKIPKRIIIEKISYVLLRNGLEITRRGLSELISDLTQKGFTILSVMNPDMHPSDQTNADLICLMEKSVSRSLMNH